MASRLPVWYMGQDGKAENRKQEPGRKLWQIACVLVHFMENHMFYIRDGYFDTSYICRSI